MGIEVMRKNRTRKRFSGTRLFSSPTNHSEAFVTSFLACGVQVRPCIVYTWCGNPFDKSILEIAHNFSFPTQTPTTKMQRRINNPFPCALFVVKLSTRCFASGVAIMYKSLVAQVDLPYWYPCQSGSAL